MQAVARSKEIKTSTRKVRLVADSIRDLSVNEALDALSVINKKGAYDLEKALRAAISNAVNNSGLDKNTLAIKTIDIGEGTSLKRFRPSTRGRVHRYKKRTTNIRITLEEKVKVQAIQSKNDIKMIEEPKKAEEAESSNEKKGKK